MGRSYDRIQLVTAKDIAENGKRLELPMSLEVSKAAHLRAQGNQPELLGLE